MPVVREQYRDGAAILATYPWEINHADEDGQPRSVNLTRTAVTTGVGFVRQQGDTGPLIYRFKGTILSAAQYTAMVNYANACMGVGTAPRTVFYTGIDAVEHEVLITEFTPLRVRVAQNPRGTGAMLYFIYTYTLTMEVIT